MTVKAGTISPRERLRAAVNGQDIERPPVSLWRHFPEEDQTPDDLASATLRWQDAFSFDFIKFMPPGDYPTIDWGGESQFQGALGGTRTTTNFPISSIEDWAQLWNLDTDKGFNGLILDALSQTRDRLDPGVPLLQTIFSPLTIAQKLSSGQAIAHLRTNPEVVLPALELVSTVTRSMLVRSIERGADGVFFATQCADESIFSESEYRSMALSHDLQVLSALPADAFLMIHLHGSRPLLGLHDSYPQAILNWHDRRFGPTLSSIRGLTGRCVAGGINEATIATDDPGRVVDDVRDAIEQTAGHSVIVAPGCVIPTNTSEATVALVVDAVKSYGSAS